jgi:hypothetical protein
MPSFPLQHAPPHGSRRPVLVALRRAADPQTLLILPSPFPLPLFSPPPQLGAAVPLSTKAVTRPTYVVTDAAGTTRLANCKAVAANLNHTLFLTSDGAVYAAGRNGCERHCAFYVLGLVMVLLGGVFGIWGVELVWDCQPAVADLNTPCF